MPGRFFNISKKPDTEFDRSGLAHFTNWEEQESCYYDFTSSNKQTGLIIFDESEENKYRAEKQSNCPITSKGGRWSLGADNPKERNITGLSRKLLIILFKKQLIFHSNHTSIWNIRITPVNWSRLEQNCYKKKTDFYLVFRNNLKVLKNNS